MVEFPNKKANLAAAILLILMFLLAIFSLRDDSATSDELAHIPAGYSYLTQKDYRLNPEHPPLVKDLAATPLLFLNLNFPKDSPFWQNSEQWQFGREFLYWAGNNPDQILFWARLPMVLLLIFLGWFLFHWAKELAGNKVALLVLTFFSFSPTFLAHGRLVTTDLAAALGVVLATYFWLKFLKNPSKKNIIFSGLIFGLALLFKFSLLILIPFFGLITIIYAWFKTRNPRPVFEYIGQAILVGIISILVIWLIYQFQIASYFSGASIAMERATSPSWWPTYFLGQISQSGFWNYFPIVYFLKVPLAFHILTLIALLAIFGEMRKKSIQIKEWILNHFPEFSMLIFLLVYWIVALKSPLNIGIRHLLPTLPFTYILVSLGIKNFLERIKMVKFKKVALSLVLLLLAWYLISSFSSFPYHLSYFNELADGPRNGYQYLVDSNLDWGQDLKRLAKWVEKQEIEKIYVDYFGGGDLKYYLKERAIPWYGSSWWSFANWQTTEEFPKGNYLAVSATFLQGGRGEPTPGFNWPAGEYNWLNDYQPIT